MEPMQNDKKYYIDKTEVLEKEIAGFPSIYIEGAAASGKTTAVRMLLESHSEEVEPMIFQMDEEVMRPEEFLKKLTGFRREREKAYWIVLENVPGKMDSELTRTIIRLVRELNGKSRVIMTGRERPPEGLLELLWKSEMAVLPQNVLAFSIEEIRILAEYIGSHLQPAEIYQVTGGWAGCVEVMLYTSKRSDLTAEELRRSYEIDTYIRQNILDRLSGEEWEILRRSAVCPWLDSALCREVWNIENPDVTLEMLTRKGILLCDSSRRRWKLAPLFTETFRSEEKRVDRMFWIRLGKWYGTYGYAREMMLCLKKSGDLQCLYKAMKKCYAQIPFLGIPYEEVMSWKDNSPEVCYLRGMYCRASQNQKGLDREISRLEEHRPGKDERIGGLWAEVYLNLTYLKTDLPLEEWLTLLKLNVSGETVKNKKKLHLYGMLGEGFSFLCGARDLTALFSCSRKEENRLARLWGECLGEGEYIAYRLARLEYYLETERKEAIPEEDLELLMKTDSLVGTEVLGEQIGLNIFYLLCRLQRKSYDEDRENRIEFLEKELLQSGYPNCAANVTALASIYSPWRREKERLIRWIHESEQKERACPGKENVVVLYCRGKGYLFLHQYEKAEKVFRKLALYLQNYHYRRIYAEVLFEQAIAEWNLERHGQALRSMISSFVVNGSARYVGFYSEYGKQGKDVLEAYIEWMKKNSPEGWHRKKKYNYGNVLRMPEVDYLETILRCANRERRNIPMLLEQKREERLTLMENLILQDIRKGLTNAQICEEQNLKMSTVKSHIYSLYKKLGVRNRVQALRKGREIGIIE